MAEQVSVSHVYASYMLNRCPQEPSYNHLLSDSCINRLCINRFSMYIHAYNVYCKDMPMAIAAMHLYHVNVLVVFKGFRTEKSLTRGQLAVDI